MNMFSNVPWLNHQLILLPQTLPCHLKRNHFKRNFHLPTIIFQSRKCQFSGKLYIYIYTTSWSPCQDLPNSFFTGIYDSKLHSLLNSQSSVAFAKTDFESIRFLTGRKVQQSLQIALEATGRSGVKKKIDVAGFWTEGRKFGNKNEVDLKRSFTKEYTNFFSAEFQGMGFDGR